MRIIRYHVIDKRTDKVVYTECRRDRAVAFMKGLSEAENYTLGYAWMSV